MQFLYLDTSVYVAAWLSESKRLVYVPYHFDALCKSIKTGSYTVVVTPLIKNEIKKKYPFLLDNFKDMIRGLDRGVWQIGITREHINKAKSLCKKYKELHQSDSVHLAVAIDHAKIFVTEDKKQHNVASEEMETRWIEEL